jgi:hypothetical protein
MSRKSTKAIVAKEIRYIIRKSGSARRIPSVQELAGQCACLCREARKETVEAFWIMSRFQFGRTLSLVPQTRELRLCGGVKWAVDARVGHQW